MTKARPHSHGGPQGPSQRQLRVSEVIRRALSEILARGELHEPGLAETSITVGEVRMAPHLRHAPAVVPPPGGVNTSGVLKALTRNRHELRRMVTRQIDLKYSPELSFEPDRTFEQMDRTRELLDSPEVRRDLDED